MNNSRKIYLASSWRNELQPAVVGILRGEGHEVYDFRHPYPGYEGFQWRDAGLMSERETTPVAFRSILTNPICDRGYNADMRGIQWSDTCVLLLPCGKSAHLEAGYCAADGKDVFVAMFGETCEPELMYKMTNGICTTIDELIEELAKP